MSSICNVCEIDFTDASQTKNLGKSVVQMMKDVAVEGDEYMIKAFTENKEHFDVLAPYVTYLFTCLTYYSIKSGY